MDYCLNTFVQLITIDKESLELLNLILNSIKGRFYMFQLNLISAFIERCQEPITFNPRTLFLASCTLQQQLRILNYWTFLEDLLFSFNIQNIFFWISNALRQPNFHIPKGLKLERKINQWKFHNALIFFRLITVLSSSRKTSSFTFGIRFLCNCW